MKYLFFDTETSGIIKDYKDPSTWPRLVQIAWITFDNNKRTSTNSFIVIPDGFIIPESATKIHGITTKQAILDGSPLVPVLESFKADAETSNYIIGHNLGFDRRIVRGELIRMGIDMNTDDKIKICTMHKSTKYAQIPNVNKAGYKWPKLEELYRVLFKEEILNQHNALADVEATVRCFWELKRLGVITE